MPVSYVKFPMEFWVYIPGNGNVAAAALITHVSTFTSDQIRSVAQ